MQENSGIMHPSNYVDGSHGVGEGDLAAEGFPDRAGHLSLHVREGYSLGGTSVRNGQAGRPSVAHRRDGAKLRAGLPGRPPQCCCHAP